MLHEIGCLVLLSRLNRLVKYETDAPLLPWVMFSRWSASFANLSCQQTAAAKGNQKRPSKSTNNNVFTCYSLCNIRDLLLNFIPPPLHFTTSSSSPEEPLHQTPDYTEWAEHLLQQPQCELIKWKPEDRKDIMIGTCHRRHHFGTNLGTRAQRSDFRKRHLKWTNGTEMTKVNTQK